VQILIAKKVLFRRISRMSPTIEQLAQEQPTTANKEQASKASPSLPSIDENDALKYCKDIVEAQSREDVFRSIPRIPVPQELKQDVQEIASTPRSPDEKSESMSEHIKNSTVPLSIGSQGERGSGTVVGVSQDGSKILITSGIHAFLSDLGVEPNDFSEEDMIVNGKDTIRDLINNKQSQNSINLNFDHERFQAKSAKYVSVAPNENGEQLLIEVELDSPLTKDEAKELAVDMADSSNLEKNSNVMTSGYAYLTDSNESVYSMSENARVVSSGKQQLVVNESNDDARDDKTYNDLRLISGADGIHPGTSGGGEFIVSKDAEGKKQIVHSGIISAKDENGIGWISQNDSSILEARKSWLESF
jgi:hypothetical protein